MMTVGSLGPGAFARGALDGVFAGLGAFAGEGAFAECLWEGAFAKPLVESADRCRTAAASKTQEFSA